MPMLYEQFRGHYVQLRNRRMIGIIEAGHLFLENRTSIVYLYNEIKKSIKEGVDQFGWS